MSFDYYNGFNTAQRLDERGHMGADLGLPGRPVRPPDLGDPGPAAHRRRHVLRPHGGFGGAFPASAGGASFFNTRNRLGIGLDVVLEAGSYQGCWIGGLQLVASPEFHF